MPRAIRLSAVLCLPWPTAYLRPAAAPKRWPFRRSFDSAQFDHFVLREEARPTPGGLSGISTRLRMRELRLPRKSGSSIYDKEPPKRQSESERYDSITANASLRGAKIIYKAVNADLLVGRRADKAPAVALRGPPYHVSYPLLSLIYNSFICRSHLNHIRPRHLYYYLPSPSPVARRPSPIADALTFLMDFLPPSIVLCSSLMLGISVSVSIVKCDSNSQIASLKN